ncbi:MAG: hypothetical protein EOP61_20130 [Sphingomonadales bacterium]|nr:MAG: hypothetical protein EOP61_20130 [Sphingomonadales bacterium]
MLLQRSSSPEARIAGPIARILEVQQANGLIPWFEDGPWDSWNHAECVMALAVAGEYRAARAGLDALVSAQGSDGAFLCEYGNALPMADHVSIARVAGPKVKDTNFTAYVATAVEHYRRLKGAKAAGEYWPMVRAAIDHVLDHQHEAGDVSWCAEVHGTSLDDALIAGNASIFGSLDHAILLGGALRDPQPRWQDAHRRLGEVLQQAPKRFDRSGKARGAFAMDWYYPALTGVLTGDEAVARLRRDWPRFVEPGLGCRCVVDEPWVTVAETCELVIAALRCGMGKQAEELIDRIEQRRDARGAFWMGWQFVEAIHWPAERPSWTQAAYVLAIDAFERLTPASTIFAD